MRLVKGLGPSSHSSGAATHAATWQCQRSGSADPGFVHYTSARSTSHPIVRRPLRGWASPPRVYVQIARMLHLTRPVTASPHSCVSVAEADAPMDAPMRGARRLECTV